MRRKAIFAAIHFGDRDGDALTGPDAQRLGQCAAQVQKALKDGWTQCSDAIDIGDDAEFLEDAIQQRL